MLRFMLPFNAHDTKETRNSGPFPLMHRYFFLFRFHIEFSMNPGERTHYKDNILEIDEANNSSQNHVHRSERLNRIEDII